MNGIALLVTLLVSSRGLLAQACPKYCECEQSQITCCLDSEQNADSTKCQSGRDFPAWKSPEYVKCSIPFKSVSIELQANSWPPSAGTRFLRYDRDSCTAGPGFSHNKGTEELIIRGDSQRHEAHDGIHELTYQDLRGLLHSFANLRKLIIEHTQMEIIASGLMERVNATAIEEVTIRWNRNLHEARDGWLFKCNRIARLDLSNNALQEIGGWGITKKQTLFKHLNLNNNKLTELKPRVLATMPFLEELLLDGNAFTRLDADLFSGLHNLRLLSLRDNGQLRLVGNLAVKLPQLESLFLDGNWLQTEAGSARHWWLSEGCPASLARLSLKSTELTNNSEQLFLALDQCPSLRQVDLSKNPDLHCIGENLLGGQVTDRHRTEFLPGHLVPCLSLVSSTAKPTVQDLIESDDFFENVYNALFGGANLGSKGSKSWNGMVICIVLAVIVVLLITLVAVLTCFCYKYRCRKPRKSAMAYRMQRAPMQQAAVMLHPRPSPVFYTPVTHPPMFLGLGGNKSPSSSLLQVSSAEGCGPLKKDSNSSSLNDSGFGQAVPVTSEATLKLPTSNSEFFLQSRVASPTPSSINGGPGGGLAMPQAYILTPCPPMMTTFLPPAASTSNRHSVYWTESPFAPMLDNGSGSRICVSPTFSELVFKTSDNTGTLRSNQQSHNHPHPHHQHPDARSFITTSMHEDFS